MNAIFRAVLRPTILNMVAKVYIPVLFPLTFLIALIALKLDTILGFETGFLPQPAHLFVALVTWIIVLIALFFEERLDYFGL